MPREGHREIPEPTADDPVGEALVNELDQQIANQGMAGFVVVITQKRAHWRIRPDAPWTAMSLDRTTGEMRLRSKTRDYKTREQAKRTLELSLHVIYQLRDLFTLNLAPLLGLIERIETESDIEVEHHAGHDFIPGGGYKPKGN